MHRARQGEKPVVLVARRRVSVTFRLRRDLDAYVREQADAANLTQTAIVERAIERDRRAERRRYAQQVALEEAAENKAFADAAVRASGGVFLADE
ncbi:MAG TPA: hypothetical protein VF802_00050 [Candidatus Limnocylindrales bacterium]